MWKHVTELVLSGPGGAGRRWRPTGVVLQNGPLRQFGANFGDSRQVFWQISAEPGALALGT